MRKRLHGEHENPINAVLAEDCFRLRHVLGERPIAAPVCQLLAIRTLRPAHQMMGEQKRDCEQRECASEGQGRCAKGNLSEEQNQEHNNAGDTAETQGGTLDGGSGR